MQALPEARALPRLPAVIRVLHLVSTGQRRGAELFVADLIQALGTAADQRVAVLRMVGPTSVDFGAPITVLGARGAGLPGVRVDLRAVRALRALILSWRPDVVQAHGGDALKYAVLAARGQTPVVERRIGAAPRWALRGVRRLGHAGLMRRAARVVAVSEAVRQEVIDRFGVPADRVITIPNGVDPGRIEPREGPAAVRHRLGVPERAEVVVALGALTWEKGPLASLALLERLGRPLAVLLFVGDGPMRGVLEYEIRRRGLVDRVLVLGSRADVADLLASSDVLILTSRTDGMEGMPASVIEAGMLGLPVAGYAVAGVPEVVVHGATGLLARPGDIDGLTRLVARLLGDERLRSKLGEAARARCRSLFDIGSIAPQYLDLYERLADAKRAA